MFSLCNNTLFNIRLFKREMKTSSKMFKSMVCLHLFDVLVLLDLTFLRSDFNELNLLAQFTCTENYKVLARVNLFNFFTSNDSVDDVDTFHSRDYRGFGILLILI